MTWLALLRHWKLIVCGIAVVSLAGTATYYRIDRDRWRGIAQVLRLDLEKVKTATAEADLKAREAKARTEAEYRRKAEEADREYQADLADARARADRYAVANRVRNPANPGAAGGAPAAPGGNGAGSPEGPGEEPFVAVSRSDFDILNENTERLKAAREWACSLEGARCE